MTACGRRIAVHQRTWPVPSISMGWNEKKYSFIYSVSWASRSGGAHPSPGHSKANAHQHGDSLWSRTHSCWFYRRDPMWSLTSVLEAVQPVISYHQRTGFIAMQPSVPKCARWPFILLESSSTPSYVFFFNSSGYLATSLSRKAWWVNQLNRRQN